MNPLSIVQKAIAYGLAALLAVSTLANVLLWLDNGSLERRLKTCDEQKAEAIGSLTLQNTAIAELKKRADAAEAAASAALVRAEGAEKANRSRIQARQEAIAAPPGGKTCSDALRSVREGLRP